MKEKTYVEDIDRSIYDVKDEERDAYKVDEGLTEAIVEQISREKKDPLWMELFRLQALQIYNEMPVPDWGPSIEGLDMSHIVTYVRPNTKMTAKWSDVPQDIKDTFERLSIPQAERKSLAGVGAQYDSELVYHNVREEVAAQGVVYTDMESALKGEYADMVQKPLYETGQTERSQICRTARSSLVRRIVCLCAAGRVGDDSAAVPISGSMRREQGSLNTRSSSWIRGRICILSRAVPHQNTMWRTSMRAVWNCLSRRARHCAIPRSRNWSKNMYNLNTKRALVKEGDGSSGCPAPSAPMYRISIR